MKRGMKDSHVVQFVVAVALIILTFLGAIIGTFNLLIFQSFTSIDVGIGGDVIARPFETLMENVSPFHFTGNAPSGMLDKYSILHALNNDVAGWLKIPNTSIDTVVVQSRSNNYYLKSDFYGNYTGYGNVYMDYRANTKDLIQNTALYAHTTVAKEQAFYDLDKYKNPSFFINNPIIEFGTLYSDYKWKVFAVYLTTVKPSDDNGSVFYYIEPNINKTNFNGYIEQVNQRVFFKTGVDVNSSDKILTLSTCAYDYGNDINTRLVVSARLLRKGESESVDKNLVKENSNYRRPQVWYDRYGRYNPYHENVAWKSATYN